MTYTIQEQSDTSGKPIFLYEFVRGSTVWRYTTHPIEYIWNSQTWLPTSASHGDVKQSGEMAKDSLSFNFSRTDGFASEFLGYSLDEVVSITVRRGHTNDGEFVVYWRGRVAGSKATGNIISIECESVFTSLRRPGLRAKYQKTCPHVHYGRGCNLDKNSWAVSGPITSVSGTTVVMAIAGTYPDGHFRAGMIEASDGTLRFIVSHIGSTLTLIRTLGPLQDQFDNIGSGFSVRIFPGCIRTKEECLNKFNNILNMGGFPFIPSKNPFSGSSIV